MHLSTVRDAALCWEGSQPISLLRNSSSSSPSSSQAAVSFLGLKSWNDLETLHTSDNSFGIIKLIKSPMITNYPGAASNTA